MLLVRSDGLTRRYGYEVSSVSKGTLDDLFRLAAGEAGIECDGALVTGFVPPARLMPRGARRHFGRFGSR